MLSAVKSPNGEIINEIQSSNTSSKPDTPKPVINTIKPTSRSLSTVSFSDPHTHSQLQIPDGSVLTIRMSPRDTPRRKYFDSGDYELAKVGIVSATSVGSIHVSPEKLAASRSGSLHHIQPIIFDDSCSQDDLRYQLTPNATIISRSNNSIKCAISEASLEETE